MKGRKRHAIRFIQFFCHFFVIVSLTLTVSVSLFTRGLESALGIKFTEAQLRESALSTFMTIFLIATVFSLVESAIYNFTVRRQISRILRFTDDLSRGEFGIHLKLTKALPADEFEEVVENLNRLSDELNSIEVLRNDFITTMSHEFKTPLAIIRNYAQLLKYDFNEDYIDTINVTAERMTGLVSDILMLSKLESRQIYPKKETFSLSEAIREVVIGREDVIEGKNLKLEVDLEEVEIESVKSLVSLLVSNLVCNAVKFTSEGGISVTLSILGDRAEFKVSDTGVGIREEDLRHVFEKHYRADKSRREGNGLGLAIVRKIADILSLDISVTSELGKGSVFTVYFPLQ